MFDEILDKPLGINDDFIYVDVEKVPVDFLVPKGEFLLIHKNEYEDLIALVKASEKHDYVDPGVPPVKNVQTRRYFAIDFPAENGPLWMNEDILKICIDAMCKNSRIEVVDVTDLVETFQTEVCIGIEGVMTSEAKDLLKEARDEILKLAVENNRLEEVIKNDTRIIDEADREIESLEDEVYRLKGILSLFTDERLVPGSVKWIKDAQDN